GRNVRSGHLVDRCFRQKIAVRNRRRIQDLDGPPAGGPPADGAPAVGLTPAGPRDGGSAARRPAALDTRAGPSAAPISAPVRRAVERSPPSGGRHKAASAGGGPDRRGSRR